MANAKLLTRMLNHRGGCLPKFFSSQIVALLLSMAITVTTPRAHAAVGLDILGDVVKPLLAPARDKAQGVMRFLWLQPYGGYAFGDGTLTASALTAPIESSYEGYFYGGRGGLLLFRTLKVGVDYTYQFGRL